MNLELFITTALIAVVFTTQAQEEEKHPKNDIGFSVRIFNNPVAPFTIMYKRQLKPTFALRFGFSLTSSSTKTNFADNVSYNVQTNVSIGPSLGAEWQKHFTKNWTFYGGVDVKPILSWTNSSDYSNSLATTQTLSNSKGVNASPFIAVRYNIVEQLYVATEASLSLSYTQTTNTTSNFISGSNGVTRAYNYAASVQPAVGLYVFYRF